MVRVRAESAVVTPARATGWYPLLIATASIGIANSVVFSLLSDLQDEYGFSDAGLGLIAGTGFLVGLIGQLLLAPFADRGHSKLLLLAGLGMAVAGSIMFAMSTTLLMLVVSPRPSSGSPNSLFMPASRAIVISISDVDVAKRLGTISGVELAGFVTGPVIGGLLVDPFGLQGAVPRGRRVRARGPADARCRASCPSRPSASTTAWRSTCCASRGSAPAC